MSNTTPKTSVISGEEVEEDEEVNSSSQSKKLRLGDRVKRKGEDDEGVIRFVGTTKFAAGTWIGIEMDKPVGKNNGSLKGVTYFKCPDKHGLFVKPSSVVLVASASEQPQSSLHQAVESLNSSSSSSLQQTQGNETSSVSPLKEANNNSTTDTQKKETQGGGGGGTTGVSLPSSTNPQNSPSEGKNGSNVPSNPSPNSSNPSNPSNPPPNPPKKEGPGSSFSSLSSFFFSSSQSQQKNQTPSSPSPSSSLPNAKETKGESKGESKGETKGETQQTQATGPQQSSSKGEENSETGGQAGNSSSSSSSLTQSNLQKREGSGLDKSGVGSESGSELGEPIEQLKISDSKTPKPIKTLLPTRKIVERNENVRKMMALQMSNSFNKTLTTMDQIYLGLNDTLGLTQEISNSLCEFNDSLVKLRSVLPTSSQWVDSFLAK